MRAPLAALLLGLGLATSSVAQTLTVPGNMAAVEGGQLFYVPQYNPSRFQAVYGSALLPGGTLVIRSIGFRPNGTTGSGVAHTYEHTLILSNQDREPLTGYGLRWSANHGPDATTVARRTQVLWPAFTRPAQAPHPFTVTLPLAVPFTYKGKALVVDLETHKDGSSAYRRSWYADAVQAGGSYTLDYGRGVSGGKGCPYDPYASSRRFSVRGFYPHLGGPLLHYGHSQAVGRKLAGFNLIGVGDSRVGSLGLPYDLSPLGAPGCTLYTDMVFTLPGQTDPASAAGTIRFSWGTVPARPSLLGAGFTSQIVVVDPTYNALGLRVSDSVKWTVGLGMVGPAEGFTFFGYQATASGQRVDPECASHAGPVLPVIRIR